MSHVASPSSTVPKVGMYSTYGYATKWRYWGMFLRFESKLHAPQTLYELECHRRSLPSGSDTTAYPPAKLGPVCAVCQVPEVHKTSVERTLRRRRRRKDETG